MDAREKLIEYMKRKYKEEKKDDGGSKKDKSSDKGVKQWAVRTYDWC
jgi:hypothetical protein